MLQSTEKILLFLFICIGFTLNVLTVHDGHNWGGDFAQYIIHAKNILNHQPYAHNIMLEKSIIYPPGFPLILAGAIKIFGLNLVVLKVINIIFWYLSVCFIYFIARLRMPHTSCILLTILFCMSSFFFIFKQNILSDIPFLCFILASIYYFELFSKSKKLRLLLIACCCMSLALLTRSAGLIVWLAAIAHCIARKEKLYVYFLLIAGLCATLFIQFLIIGFHSPGMLTSLSHDPFQAISNSFRFSSLIWQSISWFYIPGITSWALWPFLIINAILTIASPILYILFLIIFIKRIKNKEALFYEWVLIFYLGVLFIWSGFNDSPDHFTRFVFLLCPLILIFCYHRAEHKISRLALNIMTHTVLSVCIVINVFNIMMLRNFQDDEILFFKPNSEMFTFVSSNIHRNEHFMIWEPRTVTLMTGTVGTTLAWLEFNPIEQWSDICKRMGIKFIILNKTTDGGLYAKLQSSSLVTQLVWENRLYQIFWINLS